jgi:hypothetical protein
MHLAKIVVCSPYDSSRWSYNGMIYEFCKIAADLSDGMLIAPPAYYDPHHSEYTPLQRGRHAARRGVAKLRNQIGLPHLPAVKPVRIKDRYDVLFYACSFLHDLSNLDHFHGWEDCSRTRVAFVMESWSNLLDRQRAYMKYLDRFDHVFLLNASSVPNIQRMTSCRCSFLPLAADCITASPLPRPPVRDIDVYSMGRRAPSVHDQLFQAMKRHDLFYIYDPSNYGIVVDWAESRALTSNLIKRSRYFVAFDHTVGSALKQKEAGREVALSMRYFEGAAGGAVMIGSKPDCSEFEECFDWPDVVLDIPQQPDDILQLLRNFDEDRDRLNRIRRTNIIQSHLRHC